jgi:hypothetical protein
LATTVQLVELVADRRPVGQVAGEVSGQGDRLGRHRGGWFGREHVRLEVDLGELGAVLSERGDADVHDAVCGGQAGVPVVAVVEVTVAAGQHLRDVVHGGRGHGGQVGHKVSLE